MKNCYIEKTIISGKFMEKLRYTDNTKKKPTKKYLNVIDEVVNKRKNNNDDWQKRNERRDIQNLKRMLHTNFIESDIFVTLTFKKKCKDEILAKKSLRNFFDRLKRKVGKDIKYIVVLGAHKKEGIHFHIIINKVSLDVLQDVWKKDKNAGGMKVETLKFDSEVGLYGLAKYLIGANAMPYFKNYPKKKCKKWSGSANLKKPKVIKEKIVKRNIKKEPKATKGYKIINSKIIETDFGLYQRVEQRKIE